MNTIHPQRLLRLILLLLTSSFAQLAIAQTCIFTETFDNFTKGKGGNTASNWNGSGTQSASADLCDNSGWAFESAYEGEQCVRVGNSSTKGSATTPALGTSGDLVLTFRAGAYNYSDEITTIELSLNGNDKGTLDETEINLEKKKFNTYYVTITNATVDTKVKFSYYSGGKKSAPNRFFLDDVIVYEAPSEKISPTFHFSDSECAAVIDEIGETVKIPSLVFPDDIDISKITFTSDNQDVVQDGKISDGSVVISGSGTAVITAKFNGNWKYSAAEAQLALSVTQSPRPTGTFKKVTTVTGGKSYMIVASYDGENFVAIPGTFKTEKLASSIESDSFTTDDLSNVFTISGSDGNYIIQQPDRKFASYSGTSTTLTSVDEASNAKAIWSISFDSETGTADIMNNESGRHWELARFDTSIFRAYDAKGYGTPPFLYELSELEPLGNIEILSPAGYGTFYSTKAFTIPDGVKATTVQGIDDTGNLTMNWEYEGGASVPAKTALLVYAESTGEYPYYSPLVNPKALTTTNYLYGTSTDELITEPASCKYYQLTYGLIDGTRTFGFFYGAEDGGPFVNKANKAYLAIPQDLYAESMAFRLSPDDMMSEIPVLRNDETESGTIYSVTGTRINKPKHKLSKGVYVINGQKVIVK